MPYKFGTLSIFTDLTGLTNKDMRDSKPFVEVCDKLEEIFKKYKI